MRDLRSNIDGVLPAIQCVEILRICFPVEIDTCFHHRAGDFLDGFHDLQRKRPVVTSKRSESHRAVPSDHRGHSMPGRWGQDRVPHDLSVVVGVQIDEARSDKPSGTVDLLATWFAHLPDKGNQPLVDGHIGPERRLARPIDDKATPDYKIMHDVLL